MRFYQDWALRILGGHLSDGHAFYGLPGYAFALAGLYQIFGVHPWLAGLLQAGIDTVTTLIVGGVSRAALGRDCEISEPVALTAALGWALFTPAQALSIILMPTSWIVAAFWAVVWWLIAKSRTSRPSHWLLLGLGMGAMAMMVATILMLIPLVLTGIWLRYTEFPVRQRIAKLTLSTGLFFLGVYGGCSPAWIHNRFFAHEAVLLSAHSGINFWIGNNPEANGYPKIPTGLRASQAELLQDSIDVASAESGRQLSRAEVSRFWSERANGWISSHRSDWHRLMGRKFANFWNAYQYDDLSVIAQLRAEGILFPGLSFGLVAALGSAGIFTVVWHRPRTRWVSGAIALHVAALLPVFITERYRVCAVPGLLIFASSGLWSLWSSVVQRRLPAAGGQFVSSIACAYMVSIPRTDPGLWSLDHYNVGLHAYNRGNLDLARRELEKSYAYVPENAEICFALGNLWFAKGDHNRAKAFYRKTVGLNPKHASAWNNLGVMALEEKFYPVAVRFLQLAVTLEPRDAKAWYLLAKARLASGDRPGAIDAISSACKLLPEQVEFTRLRTEIEAAK